MSSVGLMVEGEQTQAVVHRTTSSWRVVKRGLDVALSLVALLVTLPLTILIVVCIKLDSRGPIFYRVRRVGYQGRPLMMLKFRKMHQGATGAPLTAKADPRLTRIGVFLTRSRLDELPQFWDVLRGRMSILGPRPEDPRFVAMHLADYEQILTVRPGIVGLAQLAYEAETSIVSDTKPIEDYVERIMPQKLTLDKLYAANTSWRLDFSIVRWAVVALILRRPVAVSRATGAISVRAPRAPGSAPGALATESVRSSEVSPNVEDCAPHPAGAHAAD
jgi:lipopolysaccharide/colanic/teichoic acid biosynthesis glycosyltransferase